MALPTFPFTPSYVYGSRRTYAVRVDRFDDQGEQRLQYSRQQGLTLTYEFHRASSSTVANIASWFLSGPGPAGRFNVVDHRDGTTHMARFGDNTFSMRREAPQQRDLRLEFVVVTSGFTLPVATVFSRPGPPDCTIDGVQSVSNWFLPPDPTVYTPPSGTIIGSGDTIQGDSGADWNFWRTTSMELFPGWYATAYGHGLMTATMNLSTYNNKLFAVPFISPRSGAVLGEVGFFLSAAGTALGKARVGLYSQRSVGMDLYPGDLIRDFGDVPLDVAGYTTIAASAQLVADRMYYLVSVHSAAGAPTAYAAALGVADARAGAWRLGLLTTNMTEGWGWSQTYSYQALPATFPTNPGAVLDDSIPTMFYRVCGSG